MAEKRKEMIEKTFDTVASGYDHPALIFFPQTAENIISTLNKTLKMASPLSQETPIHFLDVCTGTGVVALNAAQNIPQSKVIGIDLSSGMLQIAQHKAEFHKIKNVSFRQLDLDALDYEAQSFDVITCSFGLFFIDDMVAALKNLKTLLKPNGIMIISSFTQEAFEPYSSLFLENYETLGQTVPPLSWLRLSSIEQITTIFNDAGFEQLNIEEIPQGYAMADHNEWWDIVWNAGYRGLFEQIPSEQQDNFKKCHLENIKTLCGSNNFWMDTGYYLTVAEKN